MLNPAPPLFSSYQVLLDTLIEGAMVLVRRTSDALTSAEAPGSPEPPLEDGVRTFVVLSGIVRRAIVVSRYLDTVPVPREERQGRLIQAFDRVFEVYALHMIDFDVYQRSVDAEIDGEYEGDHLDLDADDDLDLDLDPDADVPGRPPASLVGELCRDFGMVIQDVPADWLEPLPADLRHLAARAAAAAVRPKVAAGRIGHLMER